jgi:hypothetical protein
MSRLMAAGLCLLSLGLCSVSADARTRGAKRSVSFSQGRLGPLGFGRRSYRATFKADGTPASLSVNRSVVVPNYLKMRNAVLFDRTREVRLTPKLSRALRQLGAASGKAGVGNIFYDKPRRNARPIVHWQRPGSFNSNIEVIGGRAIGGIKPAGQAVGATYDAVTQVQRAARR